MSSFKEFVDSVKNAPISLENNSSKKGLVTQINQSLALSEMSISNSDSEAFASEVTELAHSNEVLTELSNKIGKPYKTESEDEFVDRAKLTFAKILSGKLLK